MLILVCPNCKKEWEPLVPKGKICKHCGAANGGLIDLQPQHIRKQDPAGRLENLFAEADAIIEHHPELVQKVDQEQFQRIEKLVEGVETDDIPARLRALAEEMREVEFLLLEHKYFVALDETAEHIEQIAAELEKE